MHTERCIAPAYYVYVIKNICKFCVFEGIHSCVVSAVFSYIMIFNEFILLAGLPRIERRMVWYSLCCSFADAQLGENYMNIIDVDSVATPDKFQSFSGTKMYGVVARYKRVPVLNWARSPKFS